MPNIQHGPLYCSHNAVYWPYVQVVMCDHICLVILKCLLRYFYMFWNMFCRLCTNFKRAYIEFITLVPYSWVVETLIILTLLDAAWANGSSAKKKTSSKMSNRSPLWAHPDWSSFKKKILVIRVNIIASWPGGWQWRILLADSSHGHSFYWLPSWFNSFNYSKARSTFFRNCSYWPIRRLKLIFRPIKHLDHLKSNFGIVRNK